MEYLTLYKACDGKIFDSEDDCWKHEHDVINKTTDLRIYRRNRTRIRDIFSESDYNESYRVVIKNESALSDIKKVQHWCGIYIEVDSIGTWYYDEDNGRWVKNECTRTGVEKS